MLSPRRLVALTLATQAVLIVAAIAGMRYFALTPRWGQPRDVLVGLGAAVALAAVNWWLLRRAPANPVVSGVRKIYAELLAPLFARLGPWAVVIIGLAAGVGEELFFRGLLQPLIGLPAASVVFGLAHVAGREMAGFGVWAALMGALLGGLAMVTGGLLAPVVAHGVYDVLALTYIRRTTVPPAPASEGT
ncbi:MAG: CPBP family intramembrane metalloprotease [Vicinamibacterales bacterium]|nr:CPBP family intramembrane metalloprotease [Vicinamibacterales bacterium]